HHDSLTVHARSAERPDPITTAQRDEELAGPGIGNREFIILRGLLFAGSLKLTADALCCGTGCGFFTTRSSAGIERLDFAQLFAELVLRLHGGIKDQSIAVSAMIYDRGLPIPSESPPLPSTPICDRTDPKVRAKCRDQDR